MSYDPEAGRFINADAYVSTGQGLSGNNMFAYCGNNPTNRCDCSGDCWHNGWGWLTAGFIDCDECRKTTQATVRSTSLYVSASAFGYSVSASIDLGYDSEGDIQLFTTTSQEYGSFGLPSASVGMSTGVYGMPDVSNLEGETRYTGTSMSGPIPNTPLYATGGGNVAETADGYYGTTTNAGISLSGGPEGHGGFASTETLSGKFNWIDWVVGLFE